MSGRLREFRDQVALQAALEELIGRTETRALSARMREISRNVESPHNESHILSFVVASYRRRDVPGVLVEAGSFKGSSTAKLSLVAEAVGKRLVVFDSFQGIPDNAEPHEQSIDGHSIQGWFEGGKFRGTLENVLETVTQYGCIDVCEFVPGWFEETLPSFGESVAAAYVDVDLASSTRTCLRYLYPLLSPGGVLVSQDGDFPLVVDAFRDEQLWRRDIGCDPPRMDGLGTKKIVFVHRPPARELTPAPAIP
jgi:O-methyltransferase